MACADEVARHQRVSASKAPISVLAPPNWETFQESEDNPYEVLFLQSPKDAEYDITVSLAAHPLAGNWQDLVTRQTYHLVVFEGSSITVNEDLTLRGVRGHKWIFKGTGPDGSSKIYYRLYLVLPASVGKNQLLVMQGVAPGSRSPEAVPIFNALARTLSWGLQKDHE
jgi:hypothetical protein